MPLLSKNVSKACLQQLSTHLSVRLADGDLASSTSGGIPLPKVGVVGQNVASPRCLTEKNGVNLSRK